MTWITDQSILKAFEEYEDTFRFVVNNGTYVCEAVDKLTGKVHCTGTGTSHEGAAQDCITKLGITDKPMSESAMKIRSRLDSEKDNTIRELQARLNALQNGPSPKKAATTTN